MAASVPFFYNSYLKQQGDGTFDWDGDTWTAVLCSISYVPSATDTTFANCSAYELPTANGYDRTARKTVVLDATTATWDLTTNPGTPILKLPNFVWPVTPGTLTAKWLVLVKMVGSNNLICAINLENSGASPDGITTPGPNSVSVTTGNSLTIAFNSGLLKVTR